VIFDKVVVILVEFSDEKIYVFNPFDNITIRLVEFLDKTTCLQVYKNKSNSIIFLAGPLGSKVVLNKDLTVWQDGARPPNTCIPPSILGNMPTQWKRISHKQNARWQPLSRLKAIAFFSLQTFLVVKKCNSLYLGLVMPSNRWESPIARHTL